MKRTFIRLQKHIRPDTVIFLGDMFDGGREWKTRGGSTDDPSFVPIKRPDREKKYASYWKEKYGDAFWIKEYFRFTNMFFGHWNDFTSHAAAGQRGRKLITGLPGNHDFGFGPNVRLKARDRFQMFFGESNRVDVIANHTFVSIDGLSLSARSIDMPETKSIAKPAQEFLDSVKGAKRRAIARELKYLAGEPEYLQRPHTVIDAKDAQHATVQSFDGGASISDFPSILLTHVPLYRDPGAACGPLREKWPPASPPAKPDLRNGIPISQGYQYQNVLSETDSLDILNKVGDVVHVFSGDDHDYCELKHIQAQGGVKEITVKSMSWSMGVRKPAYLLVSLWNPVDASGQSIGTHSSGHGAHLDRKTGQPLTIETHLCLLPDQIGIFIRYLLLLSATLIVLIARAILVPIYHLTPFSASSKYVSSNTSPSSSKETVLDDLYASNSSTTFSNAHALPTRSTGTRNRSGSITPTTHGYGLASAIPVPTTSKSNFFPFMSSSAPTDGKHKRDDDYDAVEAGYSTANRRGGGVRPLTKAELAWRETWTSVWRVAWVVVVWYLWLVWRG